MPWGGRPRGIGLRGRGRCEEVGRIRPLIDFKPRKFEGRDWPHQALDPVPNTLLRRIAGVVFKAIIELMYLQSCASDVTIPSLTCSLIPTWFTYFVP